MLQKLTEKIDQKLKLKIPHHIAIIMDGNGRWAKQRGLPRIAGHKEGMETVKKVTMAASLIGIKVLTLYAFSTENWQRPSSEVNFLMRLPVDFFDAFMPDLIKENVQVQVMGYLDQLPLWTRKAVNKAIEQTKNNTGLILNFALNYGGRAEIVTAMQEIATCVAQGKLASDQIDENLIDRYLMTKNLPVAYRNPELLIRTSGEERISNFLLWQLAYSEFYFTDQYWPDFNAESLQLAIESYLRRNRRFGGLDLDK